MVFEAVMVGRRGEQAREKQGLVGVTVGGRTGEVMVVVVVM